MSLDEGKLILQALENLTTHPAAAVVPATPGWRAVFITGNIEEPESLKLKVEDVYQWEIMGFVVPDPPMPLKDLLTIGHAMEVLTKEWGRLEERPMLSKEERLKAIRQGVAKGKKLSEIIGEELGSPDLGLDLGIDFDEVQKADNSWQGMARQNGLPTFWPVTNSGSVRKVAVRVLGCLTPDDERTAEEIQRDYDAQAASIQGEGGDAAPS